MKRIDHLDIVIAVGVFATMVGVGIFVFASGGAPSGFLNQQPAEAMSLDLRELTQANLRDATASVERVRYLEETQLGLHQERLGAAIVAAAQTQQAHEALIPGFHIAAQESLHRTQWMIQETAGRSIVAAAQRMWRAGTTEAAQTRFRETLGHIEKEMAEREQTGIGQRQEALGWMVVGGQLAMDRHMGQTQEALGSAVRDNGVMTAKVETEKPLAQEALASAIFVASLPAVSPTETSSVRMASASGNPSGSKPEVPYQAGVILLAALFMVVWGVRAVAQSGGSFPTTTSASAETQYRKTG